MNATLFFISNFAIKAFIIVFRHLRSPYVSVRIVGLVRQQHKPYHTGHTRILRHICLWRYYVRTVAEKGGKIKVCYLILNLALRA